MRNHRLFFMLILFVMLFACKHTDKKTDMTNVVTDTLKGGVAVVKASADTGIEVTKGNWLKVLVAQFYNDSLLRRDTQYLHYDTSGMTKESLQAFKGVKQGDSLEFRVSSDSAFKERKPSFVKRKGFLVTKVQVNKIFRSDSAYRKDLE